MEPETVNATHNTSLLETIQKRGYVKCGVASNRQGFSVQDFNSIAEPSNLQKNDQALNLYEKSDGLEADMCRAIAIGLFGSAAGHLYFHNVDGSWGDRMASVTDGTIDILFRGTGLNTEISITHSVEMSPIIYFEPNVIMTSIDFADATSVGLQNANICSLKSTFSEKSAREYSEQYDLGWVLPEKFTPEENSFDSYETTLVALKADECDAIVGRLASLQTMLTNKKLQDTYHVVGLRANDSLPVVGVVVSEQPDWRELVNQSIWTPIKAQAKGINSDNVTIQFNDKYWTAEQLDSVNPSRIIKTLGNYAEMYQRHFGELAIPSGANNHYTAHPDGRLTAPY